MIHQWIKTSEDHNLFEIVTLQNISVTFDQFNASLLNTFVYILYLPQTLLYYNVSQFPQKLQAAQMLLEHHQHIRIIQKDHVALKTGVTAVKKHFAINERNNILKYIKTYNTI